MSRAVRFDRFGGPEVLRVEDVVDPEPDRGQLRVRVLAAGLNPMDWMIVADERVAHAFGVRPPNGFGYDLAGVVDRVGPGVAGFSVGDRVFGGAMSRAVADLAIVDPLQDVVLPLPHGLDDTSASTLGVAARTAVAALNAVDLRADDVLLVGGAAGGVGVFAVQLARVAGARVLAVASPGAAGLLRSVGVEHVLRGEHLADRVRAVADAGVTAAVDLHGVEVARTALDLGVAPARIATIAADTGDDRFVATSAYAAPADELLRVAHLVADGRLTVPVAGRFPLPQIREAVRLQASRTVHGKVVITM